MHVNRSNVLCFSLYLVTLIIVINKMNIDKNIGGMKMTMDEVKEVIQKLRMRVIVMMKYYTHSLDYILITK